MPLEQTGPSALRFLLPSVRDLIFIFLFWSLLEGPLSNRPLADADIGWQIRTGEQILATHSLPRTDSFSSTMQGQPWFAWEWLYDVMLGVVHRACGLNGVVWLCGVLVSAFFALLLSELVRRGTGLVLALVLMLLAECAATIHLYARPHIVSWLFSLLWFSVLERCEVSECGGRPRWMFWFFPASMLFWVNLHGGWLLGLALLGIYAWAAFVAAFGGSRVREPFSAIRATHRARSLAAAWLLSAAATLVNPYGWKLHAHIYRYLGDRYLMDRIDEFKSPNFHGAAERCFAVILLMVVIAFWGRRFPENRPPGNRELPLSGLLVILLACYAGFYSSRNLPVSSMLMVLVAGPILGGNFASLGDKPGAWQWLRKGTRQITAFSERMGKQEIGLRGHLWPVVSVALAFAICLQGGWVGSWQAIHAHFDGKQLPVAAVTFLENESAGTEPKREPVFSTDAWGGYLIYRLYPMRQVVVDDRHDLYGSGRIRQLLILMQAESGWQKVLADWRIRTALLPADSTLASLLRQIPQNWRLVYEDKVAVVFERR
jgi:hypothetical protein